MTLQNLKYAIEISNCSSLSQAARKLFVSQSTLSAAIKEMEDSLGVKLFNRTNKGISLTYDGEDFIKYAREIVELSQYLEQRYQVRKSIPMRFSVSSQRFPFAVRAFSHMMQDIDSDDYDIAMRECDTNSVIHDVSTNKSELGILAIHCSHLRTMQMMLSSYDIEFHEIAQLDNYVFIRSRHPLAAKDRLQLKDLEEYPFVTYDQGLEASHLSEEPLFYKIHTKNVHVSDRSSKIVLVRRSNCFSIGPDLTNSAADIYHHKGPGEIIAKPLDEPLGFLHLGYIVRTNHSISTIGMKYLELLEEDIRKIKNRGSTPDFPL